ncbi:MAG: zinc-binding alcohol dehydrogenase family protein [Polyangiaceae bacterium]|nr:zinc-binding alcohol dehydrogenase family protein [Polyangiaceae bacterium]
MITTEAWVLERGPEGAGSALDTNDFRLEEHSFPALEDDELLVEPLFGCWEGNMSHAIARRPIDVCRQRGEPRVVIGNSGVMRVLKAGPAVRDVREGDVGALWGVPKHDEFGYMMLAFGYDAPGTVGFLAKRTKIRSWMFLPIPERSGYSLEQWAVHSLRYVTAWSNWRVACGAYRLQVSPEEDPAPHVWGWGGGTTFAELDLARREGCQVAMLSGSDARLAALERAGIAGIDRRAFQGIDLDERRYAADPAYRKAYQEAEAAFLRVVRERTRGRGVSIFIDYIGTPVARATMKALGREGVLATAGWLRGMSTPINRAIECISRHVHVHTHFGRRAEALAAMEYSVRTGWMPEVTEVYDWEDVPRLAREAAAGSTRSFFPVYRVNPI